MTQARWRLWLLGGFELEDGQQRLPRLRSRASMLMLGLLATSQTQTMSREALCDALWPQAPASRVRARLRQTLSYLRALLEPPGAGPVLLADRRLVRLAPGTMWCDAAAFELAAAQRRLPQALALYKGELLPGFYDEAVLLARSRLETLAEALCAIGGAVGGSAPLPGPAADAPPVGAGVHPPYPEEQRTVVPAVASSRRHWPQHANAAFGLAPGLHELQQALLQRRLVTVHGPGGAGKTRLALALLDALHAGTGVGPGFGRLLFASLRHAHAVDEAVQAVLMAARAAHATPVASPANADAQPQSLGTALGDGSTLLVLDNAEQMAGDLADLVEDWLRRWPALRVLVTSRRLLDAEGECMLTWAGLPLPEAGAQLASLVHNPAVALYLSRARDARAEFSLRQGNAAAIHALVQALHGLPLAIELAASRVRYATPAELLAQLRGQAEAAAASGSIPGAAAAAAQASPMLDLLARKGRGAKGGRGSAGVTGSASATDAPQSSMRQVVHWSWQQATPAEQYLLGCLSQVAVPLPAALAAAAGGLGLGEAQALLHSLCDQWLLQPRQEDGGETCYALMQPVREFARASLDARSARAARCRLREGLVLACPQWRAQGPARLLREQALVTAALSHALDDSDAATAVALALALRPLWDQQPPGAALLQLLEAALPDIEAADTRLELLSLLSSACAATGQTERALAHASAALALPSSDALRSLALSRWASAHYAAGRLEVDFDSRLDEALALALRSGDPMAQARALTVQGLVACNVHQDLARADGLWARAQQVWLDMGRRESAYAMLLNRAAAWGRQGRLADALQATQTFIDVARASGIEASVAMGSIQLARLHLRGREWAPARAALLRALAICRAHGFARMQAQALMHLPGALIDGPAATLAQAARLHGFADLHWRQRHGQPPRAERRELTRGRRWLRQRLGRLAWELLKLEGAGLDPAAAATLATAVGSEAGTPHMEGAPPVPGG